MFRVPYVLAGLALVLSACSSSGPEVPEVSAFAEGTCRAAAADVRAVGATIPELGEDGSVAPAVKDALREAHQRLRALTEGAEAAVGPALAELNEKIGIVRIRADGNTYEAELGGQLTEAYEQLLGACGAR